MNKLYFFFALLLIAIVISVVLLFNTKIINTLSDQKIKEFAEFTRPPNLNITEISYFPCPVCNISTTIAKEMSKNSKVGVYHLAEWLPELVNSDSMLAIQVRKYNISRIPALIISGEIERTPFIDFRRLDAIVWEAESAPFIDVESGEIIGDIKIANIYKDCEFCRNETTWVKELEDAGVWIRSKMFLESTSKKGQHHIERYNITILPATVLSRELGNYSFIPYTWSKVGNAEDAKSAEEAEVYVTRKERPPYFDLTKNKTAGLTTIYFINDSTCTGCYDVNVHKYFLEKFSIFYKEEVYIDLSEAEKLIKKYNITKVPTIVLSREAQDYEELAKAWDQVGTIEKDGSMVFRNVDAIQATYKKLDQKIINKNAGRGKYRMEETKVEEKIKSEEIQMQSIKSDDIQKQPTQSTESHS